MAESAPTYDPQVIRDIVDDSPTAAFALDLPDGTIVAVNSAMAEILETDPDSVLGSKGPDLLAAEFREPARVALGLLSKGWLTGYQATRQFGSLGSAGANYALWFSTIQIGTCRFALGSVVPMSDNEPDNAIVHAAIPGGVVLGTADANWRITRISRDVEDMLGHLARDYAGHSFLGLVHPSEVSMFVAGLEQARQSLRTVRLSLRLGGGSEGWIDSTLFLETTTEDNPPAFGFAFARAMSGMEHPPFDEDRQRIENHVLRIVDEYSAVRAIAQLQTLPDCDHLPELSRLTTREFQVLMLLGEGERTKAIAERLFVSESTIRNHLSSIYSKFGVHTQSELLLMLRDIAQRIPQSDTSTGQASAGLTGL